MDFTNRSTPQTHTPRPVTQPSAPPESTVSKSHKKNKDFLGIGSHIGSNVLLFIVALLVAVVAWFIYTAAPTPESTFIDPTKLQAVFLNTGQVYFGNIQVLNSDYFVLTNVFYLQSNSSSTGSAATSSTSSNNSQVTLVKLGCELHAPYDRMIINGSEVTFWENLQANGQVAKAVAQYNSEHPNGQTQCTDQSQANSSQTTPQASTENGTGNSTAK